MNHHSPYLEVAARCNLDRLVCRVLREKPDPFARTLQPLYSEFTVKDCHDHAAVYGFESPVNNEQIARIYACTCHRVAGDAHKKRGCGVLHKVLVQVKGLFNIVLGRRRETGMDPCCKERQGEPYVRGESVNFRFHDANLSCGDALIRPYGHLRSSAFSDFLSALDTKASMLVALFDELKGRRGEGKPFCKGQYNKNGDCSQQMFSKYERNIYALWGMDL